jgi:hypothetical protein
VYEGRTTTAKYFSQHDDYSLSILVCYCCDVLSTYTPVSTHLLSLCKATDRNLSS